MSRVVATARRAELADLAALVALVLDARGESTASTQVCSASSDVIGTQLLGVFEVADMRIMVAEIEGVAVGFALARVILPGLFSDIAWLQVEALYVDGGHRRRGAGHALMAELGRIATAEGAERVVAMPLTGARSEQRFLARLGFAAAAAHRVVETTSLVRRLGTESLPPERRRARGLEHLIAARRRIRDSYPGDDGAGSDSLVAVGASTSRHVRREVQILRPDASVTTIS